MCATRTATKGTWRRRPRRIASTTVSRWCAAAAWRWWRDAPAPASCCASFPTTRRLATSSGDFVIVEGYDGPQPAAATSPPASAARKGYWIVHADITDPEGYKAYQAANAEPFSQFGARFLVRGGTREVAEGEVRSRTVVLEFPSYDAALACYRSPGYQAAKRLRDGKGSLDLIVVEGYDGPAH